MKKNELFISLDNSTSYNDWFSSISTMISMDISHTQNQTFLLVDGKCQLFKSKKSAIGIWRFLKLIVFGKAEHFACTRKALKMPCLAVVNADPSQI